jgi:hypothetical protein
VTMPEPDANELLRPLFDAIQEEFGARPITQEGQARRIVREAYRDGAEAERNRIVALLRDMPEPFVNAMMEARVTVTGSHMADQIRTMCAALSEMLTREGGGE